MLTAAIAPRRSLRPNCHATRARHNPSRSTPGSIFVPIQILEPPEPYLRPDPARVVVRPFKPATEPRDLNPTDKIRANHIVERVLAARCRELPRSNCAMCWRISKAATATCSTIFEARAAEMEDALEPHAAIEQDTAQPDRSLFLNEYSFEASALVQSKHRPASRSDRRAGRRLPLHPESSRRWRRACFVADVPVRHHRRGRQRVRRSDRSSRVGSKNPKPDVQARRRRYRSDLPAGRRTQRAGHLSRSPMPNRTASRTRASSNSTTTDRRRSTRPTRPTAAGRFAPSCSRRRTSISFRMTPLRRIRRAQQGHGPVSAQDRRPLRHDRPAGQREPLPDLFRRPLFLGRRRSHSSSPNIPGSSCRSAIAARRSSWTRAGCC